MIINICFLLLSRVVNFCEPFVGLTMIGMFCLRHCVIFGSFWALLYDPKGLHMAFLFFLRFWGFFQANPRSATRSNPRILIVLLDGCHSAFDLLEQGNRAARLKTELSKADDGCWFSPPWLE